MAMLDAVIAEMRLTVDDVRSISSFVAGEELTEREAEELALLADPAGFAARRREKKRAKTRKRNAAGRAMARPCPLLGDGITEDTLLHIASFLLTAWDLLCFQLACPRFAAKIIAAPGIGSGGAAAAAPEMLSLVGRRRGCGWRGAASRSVGGCHVSRSWAG